MLFFIMSVTKKKMYLCVYICWRKIVEGEGEIKKRIGNKVYPKSIHSKKEAQR